MQFINLTPHSISFRNQEGEITTIPASGTVARVAVTQVKMGKLADVPVTANVYGRVEGLPSALSIPNDTVYIVSAMVLARLGSEYRWKVIAPDTGSTAVRNEAGQIVAVTQFVGVAE